jgi:hypothetical protein
MQLSWLCGRYSKEWCIAISKIYECRIVTSENCGEVTGGKSSLNQRRAPRTALSMGKKLSSLFSNLLFIY